VIWTLPDGDTYVITPGSALLLPGLCERQHTGRPGTRNTDNPNRRTRTRPTGSERRRAGTLLSRMDHPAGKHLDQNR
jgi:hypothetical protein